MHPKTSATQPGKRKSRRNLRRLLAVTQIIHQTMGRANLTAELILQMTPTCCFRTFFFRVSQRFSLSPGTSNLVPQTFADGVYIVFVSKKKTWPLSKPAVILSSCVLVNHEGTGGEETACTRRCDIVWCTCKSWGSSRGRRRETVALAASALVLVCMTMYSVISLVEVFTTGTSYIIFATYSAYMVIGTRTSR